MVSIGVKASGTYPEQVGIREANASEPLLTRRNPETCCRNQGRFDLLGGVRRRPGVLGGRRPAYRGREPDSGFRAELREPVVAMSREKLKWQPPQGESTEAQHWGGPTRRSDEGW